MMVFGIVLGDSGTCYYSNNFGEKWEAIEKLPRHTFHSNYMLGDGKSIMVGADSEFFLYRG